MKKFNAFFIDAKNRTITPVQAEGRKDWCKLIDCHLIDYARPNTDGIHDDLIIDEEGMFDSTNDAFIRVKGFGQEYFAGSAVLIGYNGNGGTADVHMDLEQVKARVSFHTRRELVKIFA